jgi:protein SCO1/2
MRYQWIIIGILALLLSSQSSAQVSPPTTPLKVYTKWGGDFTLTDQHGLSISLSDFKDKVVILNFGYSYCPDICPSTLFVLKRLVDKLGDNVAKVQFLFITLDPERDTPEKLTEYLSYFSPAFVGLTGSLEEIKAVAQRYGTRFEKEALPSPDDYSISHTAMIYLIDQKSRIRAFYKINAPVNEINTDIEQLFEENK